MDERSHGTNSASIIAGAKHGVAKKATIVNVKISGSKGTNAAGVAEAIDEIIQEFGDYKRKKDPKFRGAVINMSLGIPGLDRSSSVGTSLKAAMGRGIQ